MTDKKTQLAGNKSCHFVIFLCGLLVVPFFLLLGCGSSVGVAPRVTPESRPVLSFSSVTPLNNETYDYTQGTPSSYQQARNTLEVHLSLYKSRPRATQKEKTSTATPISTVDTNAQEAWRQGWTGLGVRVGILDDPASDHSIVANFVMQSVAPEARALTSRENNTSIPGIMEVYNSFESLGFHIVLLELSFSRIGDSIPKPGFWVPTVQWFAAGKNYATNATTKKFFSASKIKDSSGTFIQNPESYHKDMLFVIPTGNEGAWCNGTHLDLTDEQLASRPPDVSRNLIDCNAQGVALAEARKLDPNAGDRILFVGALDYSNLLADYSMQPGEEFKNDFLSDRTDVFFFNDSGGTSFSSPRIAGAAAVVRQKFPNLDGAALKQVLLQTADDLGAPGPDPIQGHGKLNLLNALSPNGKVTPR